MTVAEPAGPVIVCVSGLPFSSVPVKVIVLPEWFVALLFLNVMRWAVNPRPSWPLGRSSHRCS